MHLLPPDPGQAHNEHSPLLQDHRVLQPTGPFADVRGDLIKELENSVDNDFSVNHLK